MSTLPTAALKSASAKETVLAAAVRVIVRDGILGMTIEAVAREAGMSKGGVLYHFASKDALLRGMLEHFLAAFEEQIQENIQADAEPIGRWMRAYLKTFFGAPQGIAADLPQPEQRNLHVAMYAAVVINRDLLGPVIQRFSERWRPAAAQDGVSQLDQAITWLAADGLWIWQVLGIIPEDSAEKQQLMQALIQRTRPISEVTEKAPQ